MPAGELTSMAVEELRIDLETATKNVGLGRLAKFVSMGEFVFCMASTFSFLMSNCYSTTVCVTCAARFQ